MIIEIGFLSRDKLTQVNANFKTQVNAKQHLESEVKEKQTQYNGLVKDLADFKANF